MLKGTNFFKSIQWKLVVIYALLILVAMQVIGVYFVRSLEKQYITNFSKSVEDRAAAQAVRVDGIAVPAQRAHGAWPGEGLALAAINCNDMRALRAAANFPKQSKRFRAAGRLGSGCQANVSLSNPGIDFAADAGELG